MLRYRSRFIRSIVDVTIGFVLVILYFTSANAQTPDIAGGTEVQKGARPWSVYVSGNWGKCSGTLIHPEWILLAGHCLDDRDPSSNILVFGATDVSQPEESQVWRIARLAIRHPDFDLSTLENDIGLIKVFPVDLGPNIRTIEIYTGTVPFTRTASIVNLTIAGWGNIDENRGNPKLHSYTGEFSCNMMSIENRFSCRDTNLSIVGFCAGDSGGEVEIPTEQGPKLLGTISAVSRGGCLLEGKRNDSVLVAPYIDWISATFAANPSYELYLPLLRNNKENTFLPFVTRGE